MKTIRLRNARANLPAIVSAAEHGQSTLITRRGGAGAMVVPVEVGRRLYPRSSPNLATYLLGVPEVIEVERDPKPLRQIDW